jgi:TnpA family transposase
MELLGREDDEGIAPLAVFIHRLGEIRDRTLENQKHRASGLNLIVTAIILWNTRWKK